MTVGWVRRIEGEFDKYFYVILFISNTSFEKVNADIISFLGVGDKQVYNI